MKKLARMCVLSYSQKWGRGWKGLCFMEKFITAALCVPFEPLQYQCIV